jgi:DNA polymerase elongation subunit (family B)
VLGEAHPDTIEAQFNLVRTLVNQDRLAPALAQLRTIDGRLRTFVGRQLDTTGSELVRRQWLATESRLQHIVFTLVLTHPKSDAVPLAADILLRWKRLAGEEEAVIARLTRGSRDPRVLDLAKRLRQAHSDLSQLVNRHDLAPRE